MELYRTILQEAEAELMIEKSRFIGYVRPVVSKEEADDFFSEIRNKHKTASHHVPAFVIGDQFGQQWASDDGEPQGTAGAPMVQMLVKEGITNVAVIVTRYFGGIKLGTGGLVRAYTSAAKAALKAAGIFDVQEMTALFIGVDYSYYGKLENMAQNGDFRLRNATFEDKVRMEIICEVEQAEQCKLWLNNVTGGTCIFFDEKQELLHLLHEEE